MSNFGLLHHRNAGGATWRKVEQNLTPKCCSTTTRPRRGWWVEQAVRVENLKVEQI